VTTPAGDSEDYGSARITITLDDSGIVQESRDLGLRIQRALVRATRDVGNQIRRNIQRGLTAASVSVRVDPDLSRFDAQLLDGLSGIGSLNIPVAPDLDEFMTRLRAALAGEEVSIRVVPDFDDFDARVRGHSPPDVTVNADVDTDRLSQALAGLGGIVGRVGSMLGSLLRFGAIGIAAAGAAQGVGLLVAALAPAAGIIAAVPAAIAGAQVALNTLKLAVLGVGDALSAAISGDAEKFQEALKELSPSAREAVTAVRDLAPELRRVQQTIQESFFEQFAGQVDNALKNLLPLGKQLSGLSGEFGKAADEGLRFAASQQALNPLRMIIQGTTQAASGLQVAVAPLVKGFLDVAAAVLAAFGPKVGQSIAQTGANIGTALSAFAASGRAVEQVREALGVFQQLGSIASNVGAILRGVFSAASDGGGGLLATLEIVTGSMREFVSSASGQSAISAVFSTLSTIAQQLGPILAALVTQVGAIAPALAPVFTTLGPAIVQVINSLGPALAAIAPSLQVVASALAEGLALIGPSLEPLGVAIGQVVVALAPLLPLVGQIVAALATVLAPVLSNLATLFQPIISALVGALMPVLPPLAAAFASLVGAMAPFAQMLGATLASALQQVLPPILALVPQLLTGLLPAFQQIMTALAPLIPLLVQLAVQAIAPLLPALAPIVTMIVQLVARFAEWVAVLAPVLTGILGVAVAIQQWASLNLITPLITGIVSGLQSFINIMLQVSGVGLSVVQAIIGAFQYLYDILVGNSIIPDLIIAITGWFGRLPGMILTALGALVSTLLGAFTSAFSAARSSISSFLSSAAAFFSQLPGRIASAVAALPGRLSAMFRSAGNSALAQARSFGSSVTSFFSSIPGRIGSALSGLGPRIAGAFTSASSRARSAVSSMISGIVSMFSGLGGRIVSAMGNVGSRIMSSITSGLPSSVRKYLPFANGGLVLGPTHALIGEAGPEVVIPLTRPRRAAQLVEQSGLMGIIGANTAGDGSSGGGGVTIAPQFTIVEAGDGETTAKRVMHRMAMAYSLG
jgi:phage-related protein